ncbi:MFS transporter [Curtobacterium pusillum]|nr:MFS transporter [Curtobacterium pusillum]GLK32744.1 MFS transporter [Curtobacterium pusillum]
MGTAMPGTRRPLRGHPTATLIAVCFGLFMVGLDATVVSIANPAIAADLGTTFSQLQWVTNAYLLALAVFLILGGKLGDRFGRRRMYLIGIVAFAVTSVAIGLVGTASGVVVFRALQGLSAALLMPQTLALLRATFPKERFALAVGVWGGASSVAIAAGPIVAGILIARLGWESVFFVNAPIAVIGVVLGALVLQESTAPHRGRFDVIGVVLLALGLFGIVLAVVQSESWGWTSPLTLGVLLGGLVLLVVFIVVELRVTAPLLPMSLFRSSSVSIGGLAVGANFFAMLGVTFFLSLYMLNLRGATGLEAGLMQLPLSGVSIVASPIGAALVRRWGVRRILTVGLLMIGAALFALTGTTQDSPYIGMAIPFVVFALGAGFTMTAGAEAVVGGAPVHLAGVAGGFQATSLQLGGALGTSVLSAVVSAGVLSGTAGLGLDTAARQGLAQGIVPSHLGAAGARVARDAFLGGLHTSFIVAGVVAVVVALLAALLVRPEPRAGQEITSAESSSPTERAIVERTNPSRAGRSR